MLATLTSASCRLHVQEIAKFLNSMQGLHILEKGLLVLHVLTGLLQTLCSLSPASSFIIPTLLLRHAFGGVKQ